MPVPPRLGQPLQIIHTRDLAEFALDLLAGNRSGAFNGVGPQASLKETFASLERVYPGARAAGLRARPVERIVRESAEWI